MINLNKDTLEIQKNTDTKRGQRRNIQKFEIIENNDERKLECTTCIHSLQIVIQFYQ
jgi:hypothetical protein